MVREQPYRHHLGLFQKRKFSGSTQTDQPETLGSGGPSHLCFNNKLGPLLHKNLKLIYKDESIVFKEAHESSSWLDIKMELKDQHMLYLGDSATITSQEPIFLATG